MLSKTNVYIILFFSFLTIGINILLFKNNAIDYIYIITNYIFIVISVLLTHKLYFYLINSSPNNFKRNIFFVSLILRVFVILILYYYFYEYWGVDLYVEEYDTVFYDQIARDISEFIKTGKFNFTALVFKIQFDDLGYISILSVIYSIYDSVLFAKIVQAIFSSWSVILMYQIGAYAFNEKAGKIAAILASSFMPLVIFSFLHTKETFMLFFILLFIKKSYDFIFKKIRFRDLFILFVSLVFVFSMRTILGGILLSSFLFFLFVNSNQISRQRKFYIGSVVTIMAIFVLQNAFFSEVIAKVLAYAGIGGDEIKTGGRSAGGIANSGQAAAAAADAPLLLGISVSTPFPSMVKTNISYYNFTMQWIFFGGLLVWAYLTYYVYYGIYYSLKRYFKQSSIILSSSLIYMVALIASTYITSIRFSIVKVTLFIFFYAVGIQSKPYKKREFLIFVIFMSLLIIVWNYIKLAGRGMI